jgi:hypothetical protein
VDLPGIKEDTMSTHKHFSQDLEQVHNSALVCETEVVTTNNQIPYNKRIARFTNMVQVHKRSIQE